ncbi:hypothetical protein BDK51DRAFT_34352 [Blyttiomyces helicus]|uniref:Uncharacterized protein n=1 Tax=Blyttiomyces helicus TaxID=388810 RepID=A0A4V1ISV2_9FUNG|nr:hypothetical protein BDK51DRAFT_34352 [Blyttiomyces helicus]|eukprot:RKO94847.1 hypothetical protein BDK51DRAFT_34352 [Blyttiomyces helicus]
MTTLSSIVWKLPNTAITSALELLEDDLDKLGYDYEFKFKPNGNQECPGWALSYSIILPDEEENSEESEYDSEECVDSEKDEKDEDDDDYDDTVREVINAKSNVHVAIVHAAINVHATLNIHAILSARINTKNNAKNNMKNNPKNNMKSNPNNNRKNNPNNNMKNNPKKNVSVEKCPREQNRSTFSKAFNVE